MNTNTVSSNNNDEPIFQIFQPPKYIGYLKITPEFSIRITKKPRWFHLKMMKLFLGWEYKAYEQD